MGIMPKTGLRHMSQYDPFAEDYHWLYSDSVLSGEPFYEKHREALDTLQPGASILDCACGIGVFALALARHGHNVEGSDASDAMIAMARERAQKESIDIVLKACAWGMLPREFSSRFGAVFCCGNSIGHCQDGTQMIASLRGMYEVLAPRGLLVLDSRNWEKLRAERPRFHLLGVRDRDQRRCIPMYVWNFPRRWRDPHEIEVVLIFEEGHQVSHRCYPITYHPFRVGELLGRMESAGFVDVGTDYDHAKDGYCVTGRRR